MLSRLRSLLLKKSRGRIRAVNFEFRALATAL